MTFVNGEFHPNGLNGPDVEQKVAPCPIEIPYGYSRDHRPDLKQFIVDLISSRDGNVPLFLQVNLSHSQLVKFTAFCTTNYQALTNLSTE